ncbi:hypothetical protein LWI29_022190 [Acer saccharum]|uniref:Uncharacterized protein n=1 Tax=Acer saccharum TaxID=4024 RepID=A0AA39RQC1_ACESA|nr:hypothetical protein LWI29_022190 [Acer saccharum]
MPIESLASTVSYCETLKESASRIPDATKRIFFGLNRNTKNHQILLEEFTIDARFFFTGKKRRLWINILDLYTLHLCPFPSKQTKIQILNITQGSRTEFPTAGITFRKKNLFFDDSVPTKPLSRFGNSPTRFIEVSTDHFGSFLRFDSFNIHDSGFPSQPERLTRFDSINSTKDFGGSDKLSRFDSISNSKDLGNSSGFFSFDDSDPFGSSSPFKVESELKFVFVAQVEFAHVDYDLKLVLVAHLNLVLVAQVKSLHHLHSQLQTLLHLFHHFSHKLTCCALPAHICCT